MNGLPLYYVGCRVMATKDIMTLGRIKKGETGTVLINDSDIVGVKWDNFVGGHDLRLLPAINCPNDVICPQGYGWYFLKSCSAIAPLDECMGMSEDEDWDDIHSELDDFLNELKEGNG